MSLLMGACFHHPVPANAPYPLPQIVIPDPDPDKWTTIDARPVEP